ncbi:DeoR/GlpR family DNA-binding transcription regulator [Salinicola halimionae]|uniref:DeoR/GlpR family DNA-binding transcription regulator n=1 Tax=Salinicola halimionae TaxID=1949081 RepID=UPI000DA17CAC|nr:DeoR/GlpR family DNA-binding transcription regulator [Salinicola halimionae]
MFNVPETRQQRLLDMLASGDPLVAQELAEAFGVSLDTIRRDIIALEQLGKAHRVRGGAVPTAPISPALPYRVVPPTSAMDAIIRRALREIDDIKTLWLDGGTSVLALAEKLPAIPGRLVMTPSPWIAVACQKNGVEVYMLGGALSPSGGINVGETAVLTASTTYADLAVLGVCGIDSEFGLSADNLQEAQLKRAMAEAAESTMALASRDKIGRRARHRALESQSLDYLVTDATEAEVAAFDHPKLEILHA